MVVSRVSFEGLPDKAIPARNVWITETKRIRGLEVESAVMIKIWWRVEAEVPLKPEPAALGSWRNESEQLHPIEETEEHRNLSKAQVVFELHGQGWSRVVG